MHSSTTMTRFARARGSKSCNVKQPEEPTSWAQMKKAMESQNSKQDSYSSAKAALDSVKKRKDDNDKPTVWGPLENDDPTNALGFLRSQLAKRRNNKGSSDSVKDKKSEVNDSADVSDVSLKKGKKKKAKGNVNGSVIKNAKVFEEASGKKEDAPVGLVDKSEKKAEKQKLENKVEEHVPEKKLKLAKKAREVWNLKDESSELLNEKKGAKRKLEDDSIGKGVEGEPDNKAKKLEEKIEIGEGEQKMVNGNFKKIEKRKHEERKGNFEDADAAQVKKQKFMNKNQGHRNSQFKNFNQPQKSSVKRFEKREKLKNLTPEERRRKPIPQTAEIFVNGESVKLQMFDGYPITKEDADRLSKLKADMLAKGLPLKDVNLAMKLERRRAEKALARLKKRVCFHCRKSGHALSECPEIIDSHEKANNVCYKCGSTEHTAYNCRVSHGNQFRFAECFICKEQGHIAKQCPDNPRGLYPKGGACNECGDVTHLKKDCPQLIEKKEEMTVTAGLRDDRMIEDLDEHLVEKKVKDVKTSVKSSKHVKF